MEIAIMIEGQNGLNWPRWQRLAQAVEDLGFAGLYRSDHFTNATPPDKDSLELWVSLTWLASHTRRIEFGPLVSPFSFRHPAITARTAAGVDDLSGGRLVLGLGAGWQEREHAHYGFDLLEKKERFQRFEEGLEVVRLLLRSDQPANFSGKFYHLQEAVMLPRPARPGGPPILIGGNGANRTLRLAARVADVWNAVFIPPAEFGKLNQQLDGYLADAGRPAGAVRRTLMTGCIYAADEARLAEKLAARAPGASQVEELRARGLVVGAGSQVLNQLAQFAAAGVERIMLQWIELDDSDGLESLAKTVFSS